MHTSKLILLVDDDPMILQLVKQLFELDGYNVALAKNGVEAIEKAVTLQPDVIVMDYMMPKLNGIAACQRINGAPETADIPIVIFSANANPDLPEQSRRAGAAIYLDKSLSIPVGLSEAVSKVLLESTPSIPS